MDADPTEEIPIERETVQESLVLALFELGRTCDRVSSRAGGTKGGGSRSCHGFNAGHRPDRTMLMTTNWCWPILVSLVGMHDWCTTISASRLKTLGNGTYFRGSQVQEHALDDGDTVVIDPFVLKFRIQKQNAAPIIHDARGPRLLVTARRYGRSVRDSRWWCDDGA